MNIKTVYAENLFKNQVVVVTGASRGIGKVVAESFGALGARVIVTYNGSAEQAKAAVTTIESFGSEAKAIQLDVSSEAHVQEVFSHIEKDVGPISILVNNAGISIDALLVRSKSVDWDKTLNTNLKGAFLCSRAVAMPMVKRKGGRIINIASVIGLTGNGGQVAYAASKAGLIALTKSVAQELGSRNILVNAIAPGYIKTDMTAAHGDKLLESIKERTPVGAIGQGQDIAHAAVFLASPGANYITGQVLTVDGGLTMVG